MTTIIIAASGPSLTRDDLELCRGHEVMAVNNAWQLCPWASHLYAGDSWWWKHYNPDFNGYRWTMSQMAYRKFGATWMQPVQAYGLVSTPGQIAHGYNSGYQAINTAYHLGASRLILLGFDMMPDGYNKHFHGDHVGLCNPEKKDFQRWIEAFDRMDTLGMEIINCSRRTALTCFERASLEDAL
jgi:hypothetical protein